METVDGVERIAGVAGLHVDDFLIGGRADSPTYAKAEKELREKFRFGKWSDAAEGFEFAGTWITQSENFEITLSQEDYTLKFIEEIEVDTKRPMGADLTKAEISSIRGALGTASGRATQSAPQYLADTSLLLCEINKGSVALIHKVNKLSRYEAQRPPEVDLPAVAWSFSDRPFGHHLGRRIQPQQERQREHYWRADRISSSSYHGWAGNSGCPDPVEVWT